MAALDQVRIVLVDCLYGGNLGATARAMKNMGLSDLALVRPREYPSKQAKIFAANAADLLEQAKVYPDLPAAIGDCQLVVATSSRARRLSLATYPAHEAALKLYAQLQHEQVAKAAIIFGSEESGLSNDELLTANMHLFIPTSKTYQVLNLAAAVQIVCYELRGAEDAATNQQLREPLLDGKVNDSNHRKRLAAIPVADNAALEKFYERVEEWLTAIDFFNPQKPAAIMHKVRRIFNRVQLKNNELALLSGMIKRSLTLIQAASGSRSRKAAAKATTAAGKRADAQLYQ